MAVQACYFKVRRKAPEESAKRIRSDGLWGVRIRSGEERCWFLLRALQNHLTLKTMYMYDFDKHKFFKKKAIKETTRKE